MAGSGNKDLAQLGEAVGLQLELESTERLVGAFSADHLGKSVRLSQQWVLIENQTAPTDRSHLGQLWTYAAGLDCASSSYRSQHRSEKSAGPAIDFLNRAIDRRVFLLRGSNRAAAASPRAALRASFLGRRQAEQPAQAGTSDHASRRGRVNRDCRRHIAPSASSLVEKAKWPLSGC